MVAIANIRGQLLTKINQEPNKNKMLKQNSYQTSPRNKVWEVREILGYNQIRQPLTPHVHTVLGPEQPLADSNFNRAFSGTNSLEFVSPALVPQSDLFHPMYHRCLSPSYTHSQNELIDWNGRQNGPVWLRSNPSAFSSHLLPFLLI